MMVVGLNPQLILIKFIFIIFFINIVLSLKVWKTHDINEPTVYNKFSVDDQPDDYNVIRTREKRDAQMSKLNIKPHISFLNDSHQQLMVHWVGIGSDVLICVARNMLVPGTMVPSAVYISYDYGDTFINKTDLFALDQSHSGYASLDRFYAHPKFNYIVVFIDSTNKVIFTTKNNGRNITRIPLDFHPSDITFIDNEPMTFLSLDKTDPARKLWFTTDLGKTWAVLQESVKSYTFSTPNKLVSRLPQIVPVHNYTFSEDDRALLFVHRQENSNGTGPLISSSTLFSAGTMIHTWNPNIHEFNIKGNFLFVTKLNEGGKKELYVSYKRGELVRAMFYTELECKHFFITDVSEEQIFVVVVHGDNLANLYTSLSIDSEKVTFALSLERIFFYYPNESWHGSWLSDTTDEAFADFHKVEGLRGIYIASYVANSSESSNIGPQHLQSVITFDRGGEWQPLTPPMFDDNGLPVKCNISQGCSLHLSQRFNQLYPTNRAAPILSSLSAPGVILATGTVGKSLKGRPGVYMSRNGGLTWRQILKDYYFFSYGDHGGVITAVKYYRSRGETREFLYSTDEGENFQSYQLPFSEDLRIYGLMTEPGYNTTTFTMFGSQQGHHQWVIVKVDLRTVFERNCSDEDYKFWSPHSEPGTHVGCVLGLKETFHKRKATSNCYNGLQYDRPYRIDVCDCHSEDFECDVGFERNLNTHQCYRNDKLTNIDPYAVPRVCPHGQFYNRTKGYRKIPGDSCIKGFESRFQPDQLPCPIEKKNEMLLIAQRDKIVTVDLRTDVMEILPISKLKNVIAIEYDMRNNCVYWADIVNDVIGRQCFSDGKSYPEIIVQSNLTSIEGMALDWVSNTLYFVDGVAGKISLIRIDIQKQGRMRRIILDKPHLAKPRGIAVHPKQGYLFWTDWEMSNPSVSRSNLDGTNVKKLFGKPIVEWPNGLTIDHIAERLYWVDARQDYIGSSDLDGKLSSFHKVIDNDDRVQHPFAVAVFKDVMYWDDWKKSSIFAADKDRGLDVRPILTDLHGLMDIKVFAHSVQEGTNACGNSSTHNCTHICVGAPGGGYSCLCPQDMVLVGETCLCPGKQPPSANGSCPFVNATCEPGFYKCPEHTCIPKEWVCDKENDCSDGSDEKYCDMPTCNSNMHRCPDGQCIPLTWVCDHDIDCSDGADEKNCTFASCKSESEFRCANERCIPSAWQCDMEDDCQDMSDEKGCNSTAGLVPCKASEFRCGAKCIPKTWRCDGEKDCALGEDEKNCTTRDCPLFQFLCANKKCIVETWVCDGENDCGDNSDEVNCSDHKLKPTTPRNPHNEICYDWTFKCVSDGKCVPVWWKCDGVNDCPDRSDEEGCENTTPMVPLSPTTTSLPTNQCPPHQFRCASGTCIQKAWVCDAMRDCENGEDEASCLDRNCAASQFMCRTDRTCIFTSQVCDGLKQCTDGSDEEDCSPHNKTSGTGGPSCAVGYFSCDTTCIPLAQRCDGRQDCYDGSDETNCESENKVYQVLSLSLDPRGTKTDSLLVYWSQSDFNLPLQFLPSIAKVNTDNAQQWKNLTWTDKTSVTFDNLEPFTTYNITIYVRTHANISDVFPPAKYLTATTSEAAPSIPTNVTAVQKSDSLVEVTWYRPQETNGPLQGFTVYISPPIPPEMQLFQALPSNISRYSAEIEHSFKPGYKYSFWVTAHTEHSESQYSVPFELNFSEMDFMEPVKGLNVLSVTETSISLKWARKQGAAVYAVRVSTRPPYPNYPVINTTEDNVILKNLAPGIKYSIDVATLPVGFSSAVSSVTVATNGTQLATVFGLKGKRGLGSSVHLTWQQYITKGRSHKEPWVMGIYYATDPAQLFNGPKKTTLQTLTFSTDVDNLQSCESYLFAIGVVEPYGRGPLSAPVVVLTAFDINAPPKNFLVERDQEDINKMIISWQASCYDINEPVGYELAIIDLSKNQTSRMTLAKSRDVVIRQSVRTYFGGRYVVYVSTSGPKARPAHPLLYNAPEIPTTLEGNVQPSKNGHYILKWSPPPNFPKEITKFRYQVILSHGDTLNLTHSRIYDTNDANLDVGDIHMTGTYTFGVKIITNDGYESEISQLKSFYAETAVAVVSPSSMGVWVPCIIGVLVLCAILVIYAVRHRRIKNTFVNFVNSHYDRRNGSTTFSADGLEDEDSPVIRGFSDDEPLVIA